MKKILITTTIFLLLAVPVYAYFSYDMLLLGQEIEAFFGAGGTFPTSLPTYTAVTASSPLTGHADDHNQLHTDVTEIATKMGTGTSNATDASANDVFTADGSGGSSWSAAASSGAPTDADYLVGTANGSLSAEIVVGATPGGELGNTWASPTVDSTHSGSAHHAAVTLTGQDYLTLTTQQITVGEIEPDDLANSDFGGFDCNGTTCTIDSDGTWTDHNSYPAACTSGFYAHTIGDTLSCTDATTEINLVVNGLGGNDLSCASQNCDVDDSFLRNDADDITAFGIIMGSATTTDTFVIGGNATTSGSMAVGTDADSATSTLIINNTDNTNNGCIQMEADDGVQYRIYISGGTLLTEIGSCR